MPLMRGPRVPAALDWLAAQNSATLFPGASAPELALAGLWLAAGGWERAHEIAQNVTTPDGAYWHASCTARNRTPGMRSTGFGKFPPIPCSQSFRVAARPFN